MQHGGTKMADEFLKNRRIRLKLVTLEFFGFDFEFFVEIRKLKIGNQYACRLKIYRIRRKGF